MIVLQLYYDTNQTCLYSQAIDFARHYSLLKYTRQIGNTYKDDNNIIIRVGFVFLTYYSTHHTCTRKIILMFKPAKVHPEPVHNNPNLSHRLQRCSQAGARPQSVNQTLVPTLCLGAVFDRRSVWYPR